VEIFLFISGGGVHSEYMKRLASVVVIFLFISGGGVRSEYITFDVSNSGDAFIHFGGRGS